MPNGDTFKRFLPVTYRPAGRQRAPEQRPLRMPGAREVELLPTGYLEALGGLRGVYRDIIDTRSEAIGRAGRGLKKLWTGEPTGPLPTREQYFAQRERLLQQAGSPLPERILAPRAGPTIPAGTTAPWPPVGPTERAVAPVAEEIRSPLEAEEIRSPLEAGKFYAEGPGGVIAGRGGPERPGAVDIATRAFEQMRGGAREREARQAYLRERERETELARRRGTPEQQIANIERRYAEGLARLDRKYDLTKDTRTRRNIERQMGELKDRTRRQIGEIRNAEIRRTQVEETRALREAEREGRTAEQRGKEQVAMTRAIGDIVTSAIVTDAVSGQKRFDADVARRAIDTLRQTDGETVANAVATTLSNINLTAQRINAMLRANPNDRAAIEAKNRIIQQYGDQFANLFVA